MGKFTYVLSFLFFLFESTSSVFAQPADSLLRVEKINSAKVERFFPGDRLRIKPEGRSWRWAVIESFDFEEGLVYFDNGAERVDDLVAIQTPGQFNRAKNIRNLMVVPGLIAAVVGGGQLIFGGVNGGFALIAGGALVGGGFLAGIILRQKYYRLPNRWRARIIDLSLD
jgi:hypothetical protein